MRGTLTLQEAIEFDNSSKAAQNALIGTNMRIALSNRIVNPKYVLHLDGNINAGGNGESWDTAFKTVAAAIDRINTIAIEDKDAQVTLKVAPDFYVITSEIEIRKSRLYIVGVGAPEDTVFFGSGLTDNMITQLGSYNIYSGITFYNHNEDKAALVFDDQLGGGAYGGFTIVENCQFSPQAVDGMAAGIGIKGANFLLIRDCRFQATKVAGIIWQTGEVGNSSRVQIENCKFIGCATGLSIGAPAYNVLSVNNIFVDGNEAAGENYTYSIAAGAGFTAGGLIDINGKHGGAAAANCFLNGGAGTMQAINPSYIVTVP